MRLGLSKMETLTSTVGELTDLINCDLIQHGAKQKIRYSFDEAMELR